MRVRDPCSHDPSLFTASLVFEHDPASKGRAARYRTGDGVAREFAFQMRGGLRRARRTPSSARRTRCSCCPPLDPRRSAVFGILRSWAAAVEVVGRDAEPERLAEAHHPRVSRRAHVIEGEHAVDLRHWPGAGLPTDLLSRVHATTPTDGDAAHFTPTWMALHALGRRIARGRTARPSFGWQTSPRIANATTGGVICVGRVVRPGNEGGDMVRSSDHPGAPGGERMRRMGE